MWIEDNKAHPNHFCQVCGTRKATHVLHYETDYMFYVCILHLKSTRDTFTNVIEDEKVEKAIEKLYGLKKTR